MELVPMSFFMSDGHHCSRLLEASRMNGKALEPPDGICWSVFSNLLDNEAQQALETSPTIGQCLRSSGECLLSGGRDGCRSLEKDLEVWKWEVGDPLHDQSWNSGWLRNWQVWNLHEGVHNCYPNSEIRLPWQLGCLTSRKLLYKPSKSTNIFLNISICIHVCSWVPNTTNTEFKSSVFLYKNWKYLYSVKCWETSIGQPSFNILYRLHVAI